MALIEERTFTSRAGLPITLRNPWESDASALVELAKSVAREEEFQVSQADEFTMTIDEEMAWIRRLNSSADDLVLVAEHNEKVIGLIDFHCNSRRKRLRHTGAFGMSVMKEYRDQGIGRALISALLDWARSHPQIEKVSLAVLATNGRAIHLYKGLGFRDEGRRIKEIKMGPDHYVDEILMCRFVKEAEAESPP